MALLPGKTTPDPQLKPSSITGTKQYQPTVSTGGTRPTSGSSFSGPSMGGSATTAAPPAAPAAPDTSQGDATKQGSDSIQAMLDAALRAIEAEYGLTQEQLLTDESDIGRQYRLLLAESQRQGRVAVEQLQAGALDRGIVQSGIFADQAAQLQAQLAEQRAAYAADRDAQLARIAAEQAALPAQQAAAQAAAAQQAAAAGLDLDVIKATANGGL